MMSSASSRFSGAPDPSPRGQGHVPTRGRGRLRPRGGGSARGSPRVAERGVALAGAFGSEHTRLSDGEATRQPTPVLALAGELQTALHFGSRGRAAISSRSAARPGLASRWQSSAVTCPPGTYRATSTPSISKRSSCRACSSSSPAALPRLLGHRASPKEPWWLQRSRNGGATPAPHAARTRPKERSDDRRRRPQANTSNPLGCGRLPRRDGRKRP
jgi:hypothetical protein